MTGQAVEEVWELPAPAGDEDLEPAAGLFGATVAGGINPVPVLALAGVDQAAGPGPDGAPAGVLVLDGLSIRWGRDDVLAQPEPATGSVDLFDPTRTWATAVNRVGQAVTLRWVLGATQGDVFFRGRIAAVQVAPKTVIYPDGTEVAGALVTLALSSVLADLANVTPAVAWPAETMGDRRARLQTAAAGVLAGGVLSRAYWYTPQVEPVAAADQVSVLDHLVALYDSSGADRMTYWPAPNWTIHLPRRYYTGLRGVAGLWWEGAGQGTPRAGKGAYIRSHSFKVPEAYYAGDPLFIDAAGLEHDPEDGFSRGPAASITRVQVSHKDAGTNYGARTSTLMTGVDEALAGVRAARLESIVAWNEWADLAGQDLADMVRQEGAAWRIPAPRWSTAATAGLEDMRQVYVLLYGGETSANVFIQRSWLPQFGIRPVFGVMGATIGYRDGGWELDLELAPVVTAVPQHAISWSEIDDGSAAYEIQWWDGDHPRGLHESVTYEDLGFCATGLAVSTIPPDQGWDQKA